MLEEFKTTGKTKKWYLSKEIATKEKSKLINCCIYSYDGQSISIDANLNMPFESFGDNTNEIKTKANKIADTGSIIGINNNTKKKSKKY